MSTIIMCEWIDTCVCLNSPVVQMQLLAPAIEMETFINSEEFITEQMLPKMSIQIPSELIEMFVDRDDVVRPRAVSYLYYNVEYLFPSGLPGENE